MLLVSLDCPFLIDSMVFSIVYYINKYCVSLSNIKEKKYHTVSFKFEDSKFNILLILESYMFEEENCV